MNRWLVCKKPRASARGDSLLLDIHLPDIDGIALYKAFKAAPQTRDIPVILMTGEAFIENVLKAISAGLNADAVYQKGDLNLDALMERVRRALAAPAPSHDASSGRDIVRRGRIAVDLLGQRVWIDGQQIPPMGARRFAILCVLLRSDGPVHRTSLLKDVWAEKENLNVVEVTINRLRQDLERFGAGRIDTTPHGYQLICDS
jgi:DNA-binding response OmpR family regulator